MFNPVTSILYQLSNIQCAVSNSRDCKISEGTLGETLSVQINLELKKKNEVVRMVSSKKEKESRIGSFSYFVVNQYNRILR